MSMLLPARGTRVLFFEAVALLVGATVGAGILGIPFVVAKTGVGLGLMYLLGLGFVAIVFNLLLGEVVARTPGTMQLAGLARRYLGTPGQVVMSVIFLVGTYSALLAYIIGEGAVLQALFGGSSFAWSLLFFVCGAVFVYRGLATVKVVELIMTVGLFIAVILLAFAAAPDMRFSDLPKAIDWSYFFLPFGVMLFAYHGSAAIPLVRTLLKRDGALFKKAVICGGALVMVMYIVFTLVVVGATGSATTEIATVGLGDMLGRGVLIIGNVFAFFSMGTCFILLGTAIRETFEWDYHLHPKVAILLTLIAPLLLFLIGARSFVQVIGIAGAFVASIEVALVVLMYFRVQKVDKTVSRAEFHMRYAPLVSAFLIGIFVLASAYSVWNFLEK